MITALLLHLGILHSPHMVHHELFHNPVDTVRVFVFHYLIPHGAFLFQVHQAHGVHFRYWFVPFELPKREETSGFWFSSVINCLAPWVLGLLHGFFLFCFPCSPKVTGISLFMQAGFKVGHHCFKTFGQPAIEAVSFQLGHTVGRQMEATKTLRCLDRKIPLSKMISLSTLHSWNNSWFKASSTFTLL